MKFVKYLKEQKLGKRLAIFWDGTTYHNSQEFREYLVLINQYLPEEKWLINCTIICLEFPKQNLVEDICLQTKNFITAFSHITTFYHFCSYFKIVK